jgi:hypothetical protein
MRSLRLLVLVGALGLGAAAVPAVAATSSTQRLSFTVQFAARSEATHTIGASGSVVYGQLDFVGPSTVNGQAATVELQSNVFYTRGSGPFDGWVTVTMADGSVLSVEMVGGRTKAQPDTTDATFTAHLVVFGGSGRFVTAKGTGSMTGSRKASLGGTVNLSLRLSTRT